MYVHNGNCKVYVHNANSKVYVHNANKVYEPKNDFQANLLMPGAVLSHVLDSNSDLSPTRSLSDTNHVLD